MRTRSIVVVLLVLFVCAGSGLAEGNLRFWIGGSAGYSAYSQTDLNDHIRSMSAVNDLPMDEINGGMSIQIDAGVVLPAGVSFGAGYKHFPGSSEISSAFERVEFNFPADAFFGIVEYNVRSASPFSLGLGASLGKINSGASFRDVVKYFGAGTYDVEGSGFYAEGRVMGNFAATPSFIIVPSIGYRLAKIPEIKVAGEVMTTPDGGNYELNYSGISAGVGIKLLFGPTGEKAE